MVATLRLEPVFLPFANRLSMQAEAWEKLSNSSCAVQAVYEMTRFQRQVCLNSEFEPFPPDCPVSILF